jgi:hypothetical protein
VSVFRRRRKHDWPPRLLKAHFPAGDYELLTVLYPDAPATTGDAIGYLTELIAVIDAAE